MRRPPCVALVLGLGLAAGHLAGCGGVPTPVTADARAGPGGGLMYPLPKGLGFVEIRSDANAPDRRARQKARSSTILAAFYRPDGTTAMSPAPTDVGVKLGSAEAGKDVALAADPKAASRFATPPGEYPDSPRGTLTARVNGEAVEVPFAAR